MDGGLRAFAAFMDGGGDTTLLVWCVTTLVAGPALVFVHELGHASVGLARTPGLVRVHVGREPGIVRGRVGRLLVTFDPRPGTARGGFAQVFAHLSRREQVALVAAGPLAHALVAAAFVAVGNPPLRFVGGVGFVTALYNLVPRVRHGRPNDGELLRQTLRRRQWREPTAADEYLARAHALFADVHRHMIEPRRRTLAYGLGDPALLRAAYAGWCWGEATGGQWARDAALDALHAATRSGAVEPELTVTAARELARLPQPPGRHLGLGFSGVRLAGVDETAQQQAFLYGIAVRDIERIRA